MAKGRRGAATGDGTRLLKKVEAFRATLAATEFGEAEALSPAHYFLLKPTFDLVMAAFDAMKAMQTPDKKHYLDPQRQVRAWDPKAAEVLALSQRLSAATAPGGMAREAKRQVLELLDGFAALDLDYPREAATSPPTGDVLAPLVRDDDRRGSVALPSPDGAPAITLHWALLGAAYLPTRNVVEAWGGNLGGDAYYVGRFEGAAGALAVRSERLGAVTFDRDGNDSPGAAAFAEPCASLNVTALVRALGEAARPSLRDGAKLTTARQPRAVTAEVTWSRDGEAWALEAHLHEAKRVIRDVFQRFRFDEGGGVTARCDFERRP